MLPPHLRVGGAGGPYLNLNLLTALCNDSVGRHCSALPHGCQIPLWGWGTVRYYCPEQLPVRGQEVAHPISPQRAVHTTNAVRCHAHQSGGATANGRSNVCLTNMLLASCSTSILCVRRKDSSLPWVTPIVTAASIYHTLPAQSQRKAAGSDFAPSLCPLR